MIGYLFHAEARMEFYEAAHYYESKRIGLGLRFHNAVDQTLHRIRLRPLTYRKIDAGCRQCTVVGFPYIVIYRIRNEQLEILAVMHTHRKPGYWKDRNRC